MCKGVKSLVNKVIDVVKSAWRSIRKFVAVLIVFAAIFFPYLWPLVASYLPAGLVTFVTASFPAATSIVFSVSWEAMALRGVIGFATASIVSSEGAAKAAEIVSGAVKDTVKFVSDVAAGAAGGVVDSFLEQPLFWAVAATALFFALRRGSDGKRGYEVFIGGNADEKKATKRIGTASETDDSDFSKPLAEGAGA